MPNTQNTGGRPPITPEELETVLQKLRPMIENGLSVNKSCYLAGVSPSNVFYWMETYEWFLERIEAYKGYKAKVVTDVFRYKLEMIRYKISLLEELRKKLTNSSEMSVSDKVLLLDQIDKLELSGNEIAFLQWAAQNDKALRDEFGARTEITGKDGAPLVQVLDSLEAPKKTDYAQLGQEAGQQMVALKPPIQNQDEVGGTGDVQTESDAIETPAGEIEQSEGTIVEG